MVLFGEIKNSNYGEREKQPKENNGRKGRREGNHPFPSPEVEEKPHK